MMLWLCLTYRLPWVCVYVWESAGYVQLDTVQSSMEVLASSVDKGPGYCIFAGEGVRF